jgi:uncharacterized iron-regulated membrane protein
LTPTLTPARETAWQRWLRQPRELKLRRAIFQAHLWSGIALGLYVFFVSITGSVLVYRNELYVAAIPDQDAMRLVSTLIELHDTLLAGPAGRQVNGVGAIAVLLMAVTGIVLWWPGRARWRRGLTLHRGVGWKRLVYDLHAMVGFWSFAFIAMFAASGAYLCFPDTFHAWADWLDPPTEANAGERFVDSALYWIAFSHFGRVNGIGLPCDGPGLCDQAVKAVWAVAGLAPAVMFATGATMWWNRVLRRALASMAARAAKR